jgi:hypothetical protein
LNIKEPTRENKFLTTQPMDTNRMYYYKTQNVKRKTSFNGYTIIDNEQHTNKNSLDDTSKDWIYNSYPKQKFLEYLDIITVRQELVNLSYTFPSLRNPPTLNKIFYWLLSRCYLAGNIGPFDEWKRSIRGY